MNICTKFSSRRRKKSQKYISPLLPVYSSFPSFHLNSACSMCSADYRELRPVAGPVAGPDGDVVHAGGPPHHVRRPAGHQARVQGDPPQQGGHQDRPGPTGYTGTSYSTFFVIYKQGIQS